MPRMIVKFAPPGSYCAMCRLQSMFRNQLVMCLYLHTKAQQYLPINLHVPCIGVFVTANPGCTVKTAPVK